MKTLNIELNPEEKRSYPIVIGQDLKNEIRNFFRKIQAKKIVIVTNTTIFAIYKNLLEEVFADCDFVTKYCILDDGEVYKNNNSLDKILTSAFDAKLERNDAFVAFGGGVVGDITGFAASIYLRGVDFVQIPTTILAQVDSSVGGKVAINTKYGKNLLGAFYQPKAVFSDLNFLKTLPKREILTGLSEVVKYSFIEKTCTGKFTDFADFLLNNAQNNLNLNVAELEQTVCRCCELKSAVVKQDEKENGLRAILNFGHTIGHAIEKCTDYKVFTHGEAVAIGMKGAFLLSLKLNKIQQDYFEFAKKLLELYSLDYKIPSNIEPDNIFKALFYDKKVKNGSLRFVLPVDYASVGVFSDVSPEIITEVIKELY